MGRKTESGRGCGAAVAVLAGMLVSACSAQVDGAASPDPAVTVVSRTTQPSAASSAARSRATTPTTTSSSSGRQALCSSAATIASSTTRSINTFNSVYNAQKSATPELVAAEGTLTAELTPVPGRLRRLPGLASLPSSDPLTTEIPAFATAVEQILAAVPLRQSAPLNTATHSYNDHLDAIKAACTS
ncbi:MAG: hypothetical protein ACXVX9_10840 [Mycobacteriaceae bacterium]